MKVLVVSVEGGGHLRPLAPLIAALVAEGDRVVVATGPNGKEAVDEAGAEHWPSGRRETDWFAILAARTRGAPGDGIVPARINHYFVPRLFGEIAASDMVDDALAAGRSLSPDVVVFETYSFAAPLVAEVLGVPSVHHTIGPPPDPEVLALANDAVSPMWRSFDLEAPIDAGVYRGPTIDIWPVSLSDAAAIKGERVELRPAGPSIDRAAPEEPPLVYVTLGTFFSANLAAFAPILEALSAAPVSVVVTVGADADPADLGPLAENVRAERFVAQSELLPRCSAVVHHGGAGTMLGSLAAGLAQVVIPQGADNVINANHLEAAGAGISIEPAEVTPKAVREAVEKVLTDSSYATSARAVGAEIAAMAPPKTSPRSYGLATATPAD